MDAASGIALPLWAIRPLRPASPGFAEGDLLVPAIRPLLPCGSMSCLRLLGRYSDFRQGCRVRAPMPDHHTADATQHSAAAAAPADLAASPPRLPRRPSMARRFMQARLPWSLSSGLEHSGAWLRCSHSHRWTFRQPMLGFSFQITNYELFMLAAGGIITIPSSTALQQPH
eukprot:TRINITY_DN17117_c0_g1_i4.p1 TRINITY_DN17117_c0_g1~~TRINITY_DN17117_c0_g1_i4.p1  ORF type:complete len:179 (+),score=13.04 TRINITY_DN17117_c0_g1_i4:26-538(+)